MSIFRPSLSGFWTDGLSSTLKAYAAAAGISGASVSRLDSFFRDIKAAGFNPVQLFVGKSEFGGLDGSTFHAVVGGDGVLTGSFAQDADGISFAGSSEVFEFPNPVQGAAVPELTMFLGFTPTAAADMAGISSYYGATALTNKGPDLNIGRGRVSANTPTDRMGVSGTSETGNENYGDSPYVTTLAGESRVIGFHWSETGDQWVGGYTRPLAMTSGIGFQQAGADPLEALWNNNANFRLGKRGDGFDGFTGDIWFAMICDHVITPEMNSKLLESLNTHAIGVFTNPTVSIWFGDSMMNGQAGGVRFYDSVSQELVNSSSGWQNMMLGTYTLPGNPIENQIAKLTTGRSHVDLMPSFDRWVHSWPGYNFGAGGTPVRDFTVEADRDEELAIYFGLYEDVLDAGYNLSIWSRLIGYDGVTPTDSAMQVGNDDWNDKIKAQVKTWQDAYPAQRIIFYDHREIYPVASDAFSGDTRTASYFVDSRHLSAAGQAQWIADYISKANGPSLDSDAATYIAAVEAAGRAVSGSEAEALNKWFCRSKATGMFAKIDHLYWRGWGVEAANAINLIDPSNSGSFGGTGMTHSDGYMTSSAGWFDYGESPLDIGVTNTDCWMMAMVLDAPPINTTIIGSRDNSNRQHRLSINSGRDFFFASSSSTASDTGYGTGLETGIFTGVLSSGDGIILNVRDVNGKTQLASNALGGGTVSSYNIFALCVNVQGTASDFHGGRHVMDAVGTGFTDADDTEATKQLGLLYEELTGSALP